MWGRDWLWAELSSSVHQYFPACNTPSLPHCTAWLHSLINRPSLQCNLPGPGINGNHMNGSSWGESVFSRGEIIILLQTPGFLREDLCNFLTKTSFNLTSNVLLCLKYYFGVGSLTGTTCWMWPINNEKKGKLFCSNLSVKGKVNWKSPNNVDISVWLDYVGRLQKFAITCYVLYENFAFVSNIFSRN